MKMHEQQDNAKSIRKDICVARTVLNDAIKGYIKKKLNARSKKAAADMAIMFADLADYDTKQEIIDYFGYGNITESQYERLLKMWDDRDQYVKDGKKYNDRVVEMLEYASRRISDPYEEFLEAADEALKEWEKGG